MFRVIYVNRFFLPILLELDLEYRYWAFVEAHPSHIVCDARAKQEAHEAIIWALTGTLLLTRPADLSSCL